MIRERVRLVLGTIVTVYLSILIVGWLGLFEHGGILSLWVLMIALLVGGIGAVWRFRQAGWLTWALLGAGVVAVLALLATAEARGEPDFVLAFPFWTLPVAILVLGGSEIFRRWRKPEPTRSSGRPGIEIAVLVLVLLVPAALRPSIPDEPQRYGLLGGLVRETPPPPVRTPAPSADRTDTEPPAGTADLPTGADSWAVAASEIMGATLGPEARISVGAWREEIEGELRTRFRAEADDGAPGRAPRRIVAIESCPDCTAAELDLLYGEWFEPFELPWSYLRPADSSDLGDRVVVTDLFGDDQVALVWQRGSARLAARQSGSDPADLARALHRAAVSGGLYDR